MQTSCKHAFILAGGLGTRLRSVVKDVPKPMAPVNGKPFLAYLMGYWAQQGLTQFTLSVGYLGEMVQDYFGNAFEGVPVQYVREIEPLGTGGALRRALAAGAFDQHPTLMLNGDTWFEASLSTLEKDFAANKCPITIALREVDTNSRYGGVALAENGLIAAFGDATSRLINSGCYIFSPTQIEERLLHSPEKFSLETDILPKLASNGDLGASVQSGRFIDIGIPEDYHRFCANPPKLG